MARTKQQQQQRRHKQVPEMWTHAPDVQYEARHYIRIMRVLGCWPITLTERGKWRQSTANHGWLTQEDCSGQGQRW